MTYLKQPGEIVTVPYDFSTVLGSRTIASIESASSASRGGGQLTKSGEAIDAARVLVRWSAGQDGIDYLTTVRVVLSDGDKAEIDGLIRVRGNGFSDEPISLEDAKLQLRVDGDSEDDLISAHITTAREWVEDYTGVILVERQITETLDSFERAQLRAWPIAADQPLTVVYDDAAGIEQTVADARLVLGARPARLAPSFGMRWPVLPSGRRRVRVTFTAGYADPAAVPAKFKAAMLVLIRGLYDERALSEEVEASAKRLCRSARMIRVG